MEIIFVLMIGIVIGSTVPVIISRDGPGHLKASMIIGVGSCALAITAGLIILATTQ